MVMRLLPNPNQLIVKVNGRTYTGTLNVPYDNIPDADGLALSANGWTTLTPVAGEEDPTGVVAAAAAQATANTANSANSGSKIGTTTNDSATAGWIGEYTSVTLAQANALALSTGNARTVATLPLTAGDWDVSGVVAFNAAGSTLVVDATASISGTNNTAGALGNFASASLGNVAVTVDPAYATPTVRASLTGNASIYLVASADFSVSTLAAYGLIRARRVR